MPPSPRSVINPGGKSGLASEPCGCKGGCGKRLSMRTRAKLLYGWVGGPLGLGPNLTPLITQVARLVAISEAESSGYTQACHLNTDGSIDRGWGQINSVHGYGSSSYDPNTCAQQIHAIFESQGYHAWSTYGGARYLAALPAAALAAQAELGTITPGGQGAFPSTAATINEPGPCVYSTKLPTLNAGVGKLGGQTICWDVVVGGIKMGLGAAGTTISLLALSYFLVRSVPGGAQASAAARRVTPSGVRLPTGAAGKVYRSAHDARERRTARADAAADRTRAQRREDLDAQVRLSREARARARSGPRTVYVTEDDPAYDRRRREQADRMTAHRARERARAQRLHGDPDAPPF